MLVVEEGREESDRKGEVRKDLSRSTKDEALLGGLTTVQT